MKNFLTTLSILLIATASYAQTYTVTRVIDGDTITVITPKKKFEIVCLLGIDTPESEPNDKAKRDSKRVGLDIETITKMGQEATEFVKGLDIKNKEAHLEFDVQERDEYGRLLAYVLMCPVHHPSFVKQSHIVVNENNIQCMMYNAIIIDSGYATPMTIPPNVKHADLFKKLYEEAREQKRGLWEDN